MIKKLYKEIFGQIFAKSIFAKSPWDDVEDDVENERKEENIFTKKRKESMNFDNFEFEFNPKIIGLVILALAALWLSSGIYKVEEGEQALIVRFGKFNRISGAGLNYHIPYPIESVQIEKVDQSRRLEIGYRSTGIAKSSGVVSARDIKTESIMLTGDENIVSLHVDVTWHIKDLSQYVFNISDQEETVKAVASSAIREVVGNTPISAILSSKKQMIAGKIEKLMQATLDQYNSGVVIEQVKLLRAEPPEEVIAAYRDVQTAKADKEKIINQSEAYKNDILPRARGEAAKLLEEANGYKVSIISKSKGDTARFEEILNQYHNNKDVMESRLYLETIEEILKDSTKVIMGGNQMLPHMAIDQANLLKNK